MGLTFLKALLKEVKEQKEPHLGLCCDAFIGLLALGCTQKPCVNFERFLIFGRAAIFTDIIIDNAKPVIRFNMEMASNFAHSFGGKN